jgi:hypothetical protein
MKHAIYITAVLGGALSLANIATAQSSYTINNTVADAFLASGSPNNPVGTDLTELNFGGAGTLAIAPASSPKGEFDSIIEFNSAAAVAQFNSTYGAGNWQITGFTLQLASNFGKQGDVPNNNIFNTINAGNFGIDWLADTTWVEGSGSPASDTPGYPTTSAVSFDSIPSLFAQGSSELGTFIYTPPGEGVYASYSLPLNSSLVSSADAGGGISLYFFAADNQVSYLFNSRTFASGHPELTITASAVPEPPVTLLLGLSSGALALIRKLKKG